MTAKNPLLKPIVKWVGGKRQLIDDIAPFIPSNVSVYVEPFVGGGAVWLHLQPKRAIINDYNGELINVYNVVRESADELITLLEEHEAADSSEHFYEVRAWDRDSSAFLRLSNVERAARIIYLNKTCYNGMFRVNNAGQLNVPYGRYKHPNIINEPGIKALEKYLHNQDIDIRCGDYASCLVDLPKGAFVYLDPPYMPITATSAFTGYTEEGFGEDEQIRLRDECLKLKEAGIKFLQSNSACERIFELYEGFTIKTVKARHFLNARAAAPTADSQITFWRFPTLSPTLRAGETRPPSSKPKTSSENLMRSGVIFNPSAYRNEYRGITKVKTDGKEKQWQTLSP